MVAVLELITYTDLIKTKLRLISMTLICHSSTRLVEKPVILSDNFVYEVVSDS